MIYKDLMILIHLYVYIAGQKLQAADKNSSSQQELTEQAKQTLSTSKKPINSQDINLHNQNSHSTRDISEATTNANDISLHIQDDGIQDDQSTKDTHDRRSFASYEDQAEMEESTHDLDDKINNKSLRADTINSTYSSQNGNKQANDIESIHSASSEAVRSVHHANNLHTNTSDILNLQTNATESDKTQQTLHSNTNTTTSNNNELLPNKTDDENKSLAANTNINTVASNVTNLQRETSRGKEIVHILYLNAGCTTFNNVTVDSNGKIKLIHLALLP